MIQNAVPVAMFPPQLTRHVVRRVGPPPLPSTGPGQTLWTRRKLIIDGSSTAVSDNTAAVSTHLHYYLNLNIFIDCISILSNCQGQKIFDNLDMSPRQVSWLLFPVSTLENFSVSLLGLLAKIKV